MRLNNRVRLITRRGFGFHSARAVAGLVRLFCGPIQLRIPHQNQTDTDLQQLQQTHKYGA